MNWIDRITCFFFGHEDDEHDFKTIYHDDGGWHDVVYSWRCLRCGRIREFER